MGNEFKQLLEGLEGSLREDIRSVGGGYLLSDPSVQCILTGKMFVPKEVLVYKKPGLIERLKWRVGDWLIELGERLGGSVDY